MRGRYVPLAALPQLSDSALERESSAGLGLSACNVQCPHSDFRCCRGEGLGCSDGTEGIRHCGLKSRVKSKLGGDEELNCDKVESEIEAMKREGIEIRSDGMDEKR